VGGAPGGPGGGASVPVSQACLHGACIAAGQKVSLLISGPHTIGRHMTYCFCRHLLCQLGMPAAMGVGCNPLLPHLLHQVPILPCVCHAPCSISDLGLDGHPLLLGQGNLAACYLGCLGGVPVAVKVPKYDTTSGGDPVGRVIAREAAIYQYLEPLQVGRYDTCCLTHLHRGYMGLHVAGAVMARAVAPQTGLHHVP
jgi:hypothetical protein